MRVPLILGTIPVVPAYRIHRTCWTLLHEGTFCMRAKAPHEVSRLAPYYIAKKIHTKVH